MIFLEQTVNQILREEGQVIVTLEDLQISWEDLEELFIGVYEQSKQYISIYDWTSQTVGPNPQKNEDWAHIRHLSINAMNGMQRFMPDFPGGYWEFNPYTKDTRSLANINYAIEAGMYPTLENLEFEKEFTFYKDIKQSFKLPCTFIPETFVLDDISVYGDRKHPDRLVFEGNNAVGDFNTRTLNGHIIFDKNYKGKMKLTSRYKGIKELDLSCELFYVWFKGALLSYIGAQKKQIDMSGIGLPFDINADGLLERGRQFLDKVEDLKGTKSHWSNF